jgi:hypothetical protein
MSQYRWIALGYASVLFLAALTNYIPGLTDEQGRAFGVFALDIFDDLLHLGSALWALTAAWLSRRASLIFLQVFGALYFADGLLGLLTGSGYLDLGILRYGIVPQPVSIRILANLPHLALGGFGLFAGFLLPRWRPN